VSTRLHLLHIGLLALIVAALVVLVISRAEPGVDLINVWLWPVIGAGLVMAVTTLHVLQRGATTLRELTGRLLLLLIMVLAMLFTTRGIKLGGLIRGQQVEVAKWQAAVESGVATNTSEGRRVWLQGAGLPGADLGPLRIASWTGAGLEGLIAIGLLLRRLDAMHA
jgi:hypothetical protein